MRLIDTKSLELVEFFNRKVPEYAILSHTWGAEEVSLQEYKNGTGTTKAGYEKISKCCENARSDGIGYAWVDTCCIDKTSSAELTEAINSMFRWYQKSAVCYAYLEEIGAAEADLLLKETGSATEETKNTFRRCRWFTRGFTLQELLAPQTLIFFSCDWQNLGQRTTWLDSITEVTQIDLQVLLGVRTIGSRSIAERMSWAANRRTTRVEDVAYCLLGIFDINMPLLYGEGHKAFTRLQEEIMKHVDDYTIFTWKAKQSLVLDDYCYDAGIIPEYKSGPFVSPLALHPSVFEESHNYRPSSSSEDRGRKENAFSKGNRGILISARIFSSKLYPIQLTILPVVDAGQRICIYTVGNHVQGYVRRALPRSLAHVDVLKMPTDITATELLFRQTLRVDANPTLYSSTFESYSRISTLWGLHWRTGYEVLRGKGPVGKASSGFWIEVAHKVELKRLFLFLGIDQNGIVKHLLVDLTHTFLDLSAHPEQEVLGWSHLFAWVANCPEIFEKPGGADTVLNTMDYQWFAPEDRLFDSGEQPLESLKMSLVEFNFQIPLDDYEHFWFSSKYPGHFQLLDPSNWFLQRKVQTRKQVGLLKS